MDSSIPSWIRYSNQNATRKHPLSAELTDSMSFLGDMGVTMEVFSGGQPGKGQGPRVGSTRHDHGGAADVFFYKEGRKLDWASPEDQPIFQEIVRRGKAAGVTGFGAGDGYMQKGSMHLGFGAPGVWGAGGKGANAPAWLREAYEGANSPAPLVTVNKDSYSLTEGEHPVYKDVQELSPDKEKPSWSELQSDAWNTQQTIPWLYENLTYQPEVDPNWRGGEDANIISSALKEANLPAEMYAERVAGSVSEDDFKYKIAKAQEDYARHQRLAEAGLAGTALSVANAILDPVAIAADIAATSVAPVYTLGKAGRIGKILQHAVSGAAGGLASEGVAAAVNPNRSSSDVLMGTVFGFGVGAVVGKLNVRGETVQEANMLQQAAQREVQAYENYGRSSAGAAQVNRNKPFLDEEGLGAVSNNELADSFMREVRFDLSAMIDKSDVPVARMLGSALVQDAGGKSGLAINGIAASEETARYTAQWFTGYNRTYNPQFAAYRKRMGVVPGTRRAAELEREFNDKVTEYIRDRAAGRHERYAQEIRTVGNKIAEIQGEILELSQNPFIREGLSADAIKGMEEVAKDPHYIMRRWSSDKIRMIDAQYGQKAIEDLIYGAIRSANSDVDEEVLRKVAVGFTRAIRQRGHGITEAMGRPVGGENFDMLKRALIEEGNLDPAAAETFLKRYTKQPDAGRDPRAKRRVLMDELYEHHVAPTDIKTGTARLRPLKLSDLLDNDASSLFTAYARQMAGQVALARVRIKDPSTGKLLVDGIKSEADWEHLLQVVKKNAADHGKDSKAVVERLQYAYDAIRGRPHKGEHTPYGKFLRLMRKFHFIRVMGQVGFAQIPEIPRIISTLGVKASFSQIPALRRVYSEETGETLLRNGLADDLEKTMGLGGERLNVSSSYRLDDLTGTIDNPMGGRSGKVENALNKAGHVVSEVSGMTQVNILSQRWAGAAIVQKFSDWAAKGRGIPKKQLTDLGIDDAMAERIATMMKTKGNLEFEKGFLTGKKVSRLYIDNWEDQEAATAFLNAVYRWSGQIIQRNDIGALSKWMAYPTAKALLQFRTFTLGAYANQTIKGLNMARNGDPSHILAAITSMGMAGLVYTVQSKILAIGREDADEWLEKRLSWGNIAAAAFSRAGWASILPMIMDTALYNTGIDPMFSQSRTTGQNSTTWFGAPSTGYLDDFGSATGAMIRSFTADGDWSQEEARAITRALPFGNTLPVVLGTNYLIGDLPRYKPRERRE